MKKCVLCAAFITAAFTPAFATLHTHTVEYTQGNAIMEGYVAYDDAFKGNRPGILVVHEWMGLNDYARMRAEMLAKLGYVAFAADIYGKGIRPASVKEAGELSTRYKSDRALLRSRVLAGLNTLKSQPLVDPNRLAAIGFCFGGTTVLELARSGATLQGVVSFHGGLSTPTPEDAKNIKTKVLILHGTDDPFVPSQEIADLEIEMDAAHVDYQLIKYPHAVHGFTNPGNTGTLPGALYNAEADRESWQAMQDFFKMILY